MIVVLSFKKVKRVRLSFRMEIWLKARIGIVWDFKFEVEMGD